MGDDSSGWKRLFCSNKILGSAAAAIFEAEVGVFRAKGLTGVEGGAGGC